MKVALLQKFSIWTIFFLLTQHQSVAATPKACNFNDVLRPIAGVKDHFEPQLQLQSARADVQSILDRFNNLWSKIKLAGNDLQYKDEIATVMQDWTNSHADTIKLSASHIESLLQQSQKAGNSLNLVALKNFSSQINGTIPYAQLDNLMKSWANLVKNLNVQDFIKQVRIKDPKVFASPLFQEMVKRVFTDGIELTLKQSMFHYQQLKIPFNLTDYFRLKSGKPWDNLYNYQNTKLDQAIVNTNESLFSTMMLELTRNSEEATIKRMESLGLRYNPSSDLPIISIEKAEGGVRVKLSDRGDPKEFSKIVGVGNTGQKASAGESVGRVGVGVGRFRASTIADFLGMRLEHRPKIDDSGSIIEIFIPNP